MKWIKSRKNFLREAKIGDVILPPQKQKFISRWGEKWLDLEEIIPNDKLITGEWELDDESKYSVLNALFNCDVKKAEEQYKDLPKEFVEVLNQSIQYLRDLESPTGVFVRAKEVLDEVDFENLGLDEMITLNYPVLRKLSNETMKSEVIQRDENGRPVMGEDGRPIKIKVTPGPIFETNYITLEAFRQDFNKYYPSNKVERDFNDSNIRNIVNIVREDINSEYKTSFKLFNQPIYLKISHNPKDILNMSISKFYTSCQHLYSGGYAQQVIGNVFDPNSVPAFIVIKTPIMNGTEVISEQLPLSRCMVRCLLDFENDPNRTEYFLDRVYPDRVRQPVFDVIKKYTKIEPVGYYGSRLGFSSPYVFTPDVGAQNDMDSPYMDTLGTKKKKYIGVNTKRMSTSMTGFSNMVVSKNAKIKELIIDTPDIPESFFDMDLNLDWLMFRFISINKIPDISRFKTKSLSFDKCKFSSSDLKDIIDTNSLEKLKLSACEVDNLDLSGVELDELQLVYTTTEPLDKVLAGSKIKKLVVSGDIFSNNKDFLNGLRKTGTKVEKIGLVI